MSKHINVNPGQYKVAGREKPGNEVAKAPQQPGAVNRGMEKGIEQKIARRGKKKSGRG